MVFVRSPQARSHGARAIFYQFDIYVDQKKAVSGSVRPSFARLPLLTLVAELATHPIMPGLKNYDARMALAAPRPRSRPTKAMLCAADRACGLRRSRHTAVYVNAGTVGRERADLRDREGVNLVLIETGSGRRVP